MSKTESSDVVVSGYFHPDKRRSASELARSAPTPRPAKATSARSRISAAKGKRQRPQVVGPTEARRAKGDIVATVEAHVAIPPVQRLYEQGKLDHDARTNWSMWQAAEKVHRHFVGCRVGVRAQDLNRVVAGSASDDLAGEEAWVHHSKQFSEACQLMGWHENNPQRGAGRIVVAVVCEEATVFEAALVYTGEARKERALAVGMDRLREGLLTLALHWRC